MKPKTRPTRVKAKTTMVLCRVYKNGDMEQTYPRMDIATNDNYAYAYLVPTPDHAAQQRELRRLRLALKDILNYGTDAHKCHMIAKKALKGRAR